MKLLLLYILTSDTLIPKTTVCPSKESGHLMEDYSVDTQSLVNFLLGIDPTPKSDMCMDSFYVYVPQVLSTHICNPISYPISYHIQYIYTYAIQYISMGPLKHAVWMISVSHNVFGAFNIGKVPL